MDVAVLLPAGYESVEVRVWPRSHVVLVDTMRDGRKVIRVIRPSQAPVAEHLDGTPQLGHSAN